MSFARYTLGLALLVAPATSLLAREPLTDPRQWMVELEGEPAVEAWLRASAPGSRAALGAAVARIEELERQLIVQAMERSGWVIARAARLLGLTYRTLQYRLEKFGIRKPA